MDGMTRYRRLAIAAAVACSALYVLIGIGVLSVGESTQEATTDLLGFGALMGAIYGLTAVAIWLLRSRVAVALIALFQLLPLIGYVAFASFREPPFELWGVLIKVCQVIVLVAASTLAIRAASSTTERQPTPKGHAA
jgi:hypothetical protein